MCCGKKREELIKAQSAEISATPGTVAAVAPAEPAAAAGPQADEALLRYMLALPITVHGDRSGREYRFTQQAAIQAVDLRDADEFLRSRLFRRLA